MLLAMPPDGLPRGSRLSKCAVIIVRDKSTFPTSKHKDYSLPMQLSYVREDILKNGTVNVDFVRIRPDSMLEEARERLT